MSQISQPQPEAWFAPLSDVRSKGQDARAATCLADLHARREQHCGQFWTPTDIAALMWSVGHASLQRSGFKMNSVSVLDNSIGIGRLVQFARPDVHEIYGVDVDAAAVGKLAAALQGAGFEHQISSDGLEACSPSGMDLALINPPFTLHLESPLLEPYACCAHGRFGAATSALSHWYALYQAVDAAALTVALMPYSVLEELEEHPDLARRLWSVVELPATAFELEGAAVRTVILVFGMQRTAPPHRVSGVEAAWKDVGALAAVADRRSVRAYLKHKRIDPTVPSIVGAVTGDNTVKIDRSGRRVKLSFKCAFTQARVMNEILDRPLGLENHKGARLPRTLRYVGDGKLLIDVLLCGESATALLTALCNCVVRAGGLPQPTSHLIGYLQRRWRELQVERIGIQRTVFDPDGDLQVEALEGGTFVALQTHLSNPKDWNSSLIKVGDSVTLEAVETPLGTRYRYAHDARSALRSKDELAPLVRLPAPVTRAGQWVQIERGRAAAFPERARALAARLVGAGASAWLGGWKYQWDDAVELSMTRGAVGGHLMGLGKSRIAVGCCLLGGERNAIIVEAGLIDEMVEQLKLLDLDPALWQVIETLDDVRQLRRINLISYQTLRKPRARGARATFASLLRRRFHTVCADEGGLLANTETQQTRALYELSARRRIALDGTPIGSYPRNLLPLVCWVSREGTASQPYGVNLPYIDASLFASAACAERGIDVFRDRFVVTEWVTHEFEDDMQSGGKREIPTLANLDAYRRFVGQHVLRRVWGEPEVAPYVKMEPPEKSVISIGWDPEHFEFYIRTAEEFASWWARSRPDMGRKLNLVQVLIRLGAAMRAASIPQAMNGPERWQGGLTSKQRWCVEELMSLDRAGATTLCYAHSPEVLNLIAGQLDHAGVPALVYSGQVDRRKRSAALNRDFRSGKVRTLLMTFGTGSRGLNLPEASHTLFYDRRWTPRQEEQALFRALRPGRSGRLKAIYAHLEGSIDVYQAQMVDFKKDTCDSGLDFATPLYQASDFEHWLAILDRFCESVGVARLKMNRELAQAA